MISEKKKGRLNFDTFGLFACIIVLSIVTFKIVYKQAFMQSDYETQLNIAMNLETLLKNVRPGWGWGVRILYFISRVFVKDMTPQLACALFTVFVNICVYLCDRYIMKIENVKHSEFWALILCFVTAIYYPRFSSNIYLGHGGPVTWHNPTNLSVKPFTIICIMLIIAMCNKIRLEVNPDKREYIWLAVLSTMSVFFKPSFYQGIVPTLGLYIIIMLIVKRGQGFINYFKICLTFVPATLVVIYQFIVSMFLQEHSGGVGIKWGATCIYTNNPYKSLVIVLLFPMVYSLLNYTKIYKNTETHIVWLFVLIAWLEKMLLFEPGPRFEDGNFEWAADLSYAIVWLYQVKNFALDLQECKDIRTLFSWQNLLCIAIIGYHLFSGLLYCWNLLTISWYLL